MTLATRQAVEIGRGLAQLQVVGETLTETSVGPDLTAEQEAQLWAQAEPIFEQLTQSAEEKMMWVPDAVNAGWLTGAVIAVSAVSPSQAADNFAYGVCQTAIPSMGAEIYPTIDADSYLNNYHRSDVVQKNFSFDSDSTKVTLIKAPKLGKLVSDEGQWSFKGKYHYWSDKEDGLDRFVIQVENDGIKVRIHYLIKLTSDPHSSFGNAPSPDDCGSGRWKISQSDFNSGTQDYAAWQRASQLSSLLATASQALTGFQDLAGSSVGQTTGEGASAQITLDSNAAGHGWYVDPTPLDNTDDYLPTSNPNLWQAKAGSAAEGKMDMLSVLLHEYGHALGLEHSADSADFMSATLQPGQRRLPSADELTLMSQLVAQLKASTTVADGSAPQAPDAPSAPLNPSAPLGALLIGRLALGRRPEDEGTNALGTSQALSQALFSANPTLQGGNLATLQDWATQGNVVASPANTGNASTPAGATLAESSTSQTRLNQVFMVGPKDRYLSFTLSNLALDDATAGPDDAFEAALINANTGANLLGQGGGIGLSHSDALLNLQAAAGGAGGSTGALAERAAQGVTHVTHPDGSRTYLVDLTGIARDADGTVAVNLSFDLIGFGSTPASMGSHVQVSDVRLLGLPQAADDSVSTAEDTPITFNPLANDTDAVQTGFAPVVIAGPAHGSVSVNADGSFSYTPEANYFGADSFTYQVSNGALASNTATVSLTITPVNDAPVAADVSVTTAEDTPVAIQFIAADADSAGANLQFVIQPHNRGFQWMQPHKGSTHARH